MKNLHFSYPKNELLITTSTFLPTKSCLCNPCGATTPQGASAWCKHWLQQGRVCIWSHTCASPKEISQIFQLLIQAPTSVSAGQKADREQLKRQGEPKPQPGHTGNMTGLPGRWLEVLLIPRTERSSCHKIQPLSPQTSATPWCPVCKGRTKSFPQTESSQN